nr:hypothetical protein [Tanacetum cinerariifolium]
IKFVKAADRPKENKTDKGETVKKPSVKSAELYRKPSKKSTVRGNQRNLNNLKSQQLGTNFVMKKKACFNCGDFDLLAYDCGLGMKKGRTCLTNSHKTMSPRTGFYKTNKTSSVNRPNVNNTRPQTTQDLMIILIQRVKRLERELKARSPHTKIHKDDRGRSSIKFRGGLLGIKCSKSFPLLVCFPTASYEDPTAKYFATVSAKEFPLLVHFPTDSEEEFPLLS